MSVFLIKPHIVYHHSSLAQTDYRSVSEHLQSSCSHFPVSVLVLFLFFFPNEPNVLEKVEHVCFLKKKGVLACLTGDYKNG